MEANGDPLVDRAVATKDRAATVVSVKVVMETSSNSRAAAAAAAVASGKHLHEPPSRLTATLSQHNAIVRLHVGGLGGESAASGL